MARRILKRIWEFNRGRDPELLQRKYEEMRKDAFAFYRGTCHLFYQDWPENSFLNKAPLVWVCGDLHLQNFGGYPADDGLIYFNINDFDESALAPCAWDLARMLTSILVASRTLKVDSRNAEALCRRFLERYTQVLKKGKALCTRFETSGGLVGELLETLKDRKRKWLLNKRTNLKGNRRNIKKDGVHALPATKQAETVVKAAINKWAKTRKNASQFHILDVARRISGIGGLGVMHYVLLVTGQGSPDHNWLLSLKEARPTSLKPKLKLPQPRWSDEAERIISIQFRSQEACPALLSRVSAFGKWFILRELQPSEDKIDLKASNPKLNRLNELIDVLGDVTASAHLRGGGRNGSAAADELISFASSKKWEKRLLKYGKIYSSQVKQDYVEFCNPKS